MKNREIMMRITALFLCGILCLGAAACGKKEEQPEEPEAVEEEVQEPEEDPEPPAIVHEEGKYYVGVILEVDCESYRTALKGFQNTLSKELGEKAVLDVRIGGDRKRCAELAARYVEEQDDMILAIGTLALDEAAKATDTVPVMGLCVADYVVTGAAATRLEPGGNVTGVADFPSVTGQYEFIQTALPEAHKIGMVYGTEVDSTYQIEMFRRYASEAGFECIQYQAEDEESLRQALEKACTETDCIYLTTDALILNNTDMIREITVARKQPVLASDRGTCRACALLSYGVNYEQTGNQAGKMSVEILTRNEGDHPASYGRTSTMRAETMKGTCGGFCNPVIAGAIGWENTAGLRELDVPADLLGPVQDAETAGEEDAAGASDAEGGQ